MGGEPVHLHSPPVLERVLGSSRAYEASRRLIGAQREMELLRDRVIRPRPGLRVLDFGCGNGRLVRFLQEVDSVGVDSNPAYISAAQAELGSPRARFVCGDVFHLDELGIEPVDVVVCLGVLHHLDDETVTRGLGAAHGLLRAGGHLVTMDPCFEPNQHASARVLMALDRGRFVRHPSDYRRLVEPIAGPVAQQIWSDVYRFPYTHCVQEARKVPAAA